MNGAVLGQDQHDKGSADDIEQNFDRKHRDPSRRDAVDAVGRSQGRQRHRKQKNGAVQHRNEDRRPAPDDRSASLAPQLAGGEKRIAGDDQRTDDDARGLRPGNRGNVTGDQPKHRAEGCRDPVNRPAMEDARRTPNHPDRDEQERGRRAGRQAGSDNVTEPQQRARGAADQVRHTPPGERANTLLRPCIQQEQAEQNGDANSNEEQRSDIQRCRSRGEIARHERKLPTVLSVRDGSPDLFAKCVTYDAVFAKALRKRTENTTKLSAIDDRSAVAMHCYFPAFWVRARAACLARYVFVTAGSAGAPGNAQCHVVGRAQRHLHARQMVCRS